MTHADVMALSSGGGLLSDFFGHGLGSTSFDDSYIPSTPHWAQDNCIANGNHCPSWRMSGIVLLMIQQILGGNFPWWDQDIETKMPSMAFEGIEEDEEDQNNCYK